MIDPVLIIKVVTCLLFAFIVWRFLLIFIIRVPKVSKSKIAEFQASLPKGFEYAYFLDGTGYSINVEEDKILLRNGKDEKTYPRSAIREINSEEGRYDINKIYGRVPLISRINCAVQNRKNKKYVFDTSGIFISVADVDHPRWQIKVSDVNYGSRCFEVLSQFLDGTLKPNK